MSNDTRPDGAPAPNEPVPHNPAYAEPDRIERVNDDRSGAGKTVILLAAALLIGGLAIVFTVFGGFGAADEDATAGLNQPTREVAENRTTATNANIAPTQGSAVVVGSDDAVTADDDNAAVVTPNAAGGKEAEIVTVPNQVKPKFAVEGDADYVETEDGLKTVDRDTGTVQPLPTE